MVTRLLRNGLPRSAPRTSQRGRPARSRRVVDFDSPQEAAAIDALFHAFAKNLGRKLANQTRNDKPPDKGASNRAHTISQHGEAD